MSVRRKSKASRRLSGCNSRRVAGVERSEIVEESIRKLIEYVSSDIEEIRSGNVDAAGRIGAEIMALNAICNAFDKIGAPKRSST